MSESKEFTIEQTHGDYDMGRTAERSSGSARTSQKLDVWLSFLANLWFGMY